jgi:hypothetical protein
LFEQAELLKLKKNGQFPDESVRIMDSERTLPEVPLTLVLMETYTTLMI